MKYDAVLIGSIASVAVAVVIVIYLVWKIAQLMKRDAQAHERERR
jgi:hypothetical protein